MNNFNWFAFIAVLVAGYAAMRKLIPAVEKMIRIETINCQTRSYCERHVGKWSE